MALTSNEAKPMERMLRAITAFSDIETKSPKLCSVRIKRRCMSEAPKPTARRSLAIGLGGACLCTRLGSSPAIAVNVVMVQKIRAMDFESID